MLYACYWRYTAFGGAFPDQWGITLSMLLMYMICIDEEKGKYRPLGYAGIILALFYTKQYFVFLVIGLCAYLLLHSLESLKKLIFYGAVGGAISAIAVYLIFPLYFCEVLPMAQGQTLSFESSYSYMQIITLSKYFAFAMIIFAVAICNYIYLFAKKKYHLKDIPYELCQIVCVLPFVYVIAKNQGTNYTYYLQLWYPYIFVFAYSLIAQILPDRFCDESEHMGRNNIKKMFDAAVLIVSILSMITIYPSFNCRFMSKEETENWKKAEKLLELYAKDGENLISMHLSDYCIKNDISSISYGQYEYNNEDNLNKYRENKIYRNLFVFDATPQILQKAIDYREEIKRKVASKEYNIVTLLYTSEFGLSDEYMMDSGYILKESIDLVVGAQVWNTRFYSCE